MRLLVLAGMITSADAFVARSSSRIPLSQLKPRRYRLHTRQTTQTIIETSPVLFTSPPKLTIRAGMGGGAGVQQTYEGARIGPPPDLPSLLLHNRIVYIGMPLVGWPVCPEYRLTRRPLSEH
jgi:hypothetical protein